jgi:hypothetical protein
LLEGTKEKTKKNTVQVSQFSHWELEAQTCWSVALSFTMFGLQRVLM